MAERVGISLTRERKFPIDDLCDENGPVSVNLLMQADSVSILEVAGKSVYLINIGLTGRNEKCEVKSEKYWQSNCRSNYLLFHLNPILLTSHSSLLNYIEIADTLVVDDASDSLGKGVSHGELFHLSTTLCVWD